MPIMRQLVAGDEAITEQFLATHPHTTMFLRSNLRNAGFAYNGARYEGTYVAAFADDRMLAMGAHYWNGNVILAASELAGEVAQEIAALSGRPVRGIIGTHVEVTAAQKALAIDRPIRYTSKEVLYALELDSLAVPAALVDGTLDARTPVDSEMPLLLDWRMAYCAETMNVADNEQTRAEQRSSLEGFHKNGEDIIVHALGVPVAYSGFNATLPDTVQIGGVWTPPEHRNRGYGRAAVAASLVAARRRNVVRAILFTDEHNVPANIAYAALGFRPVGDYGMVFFE